MAAENLIRKYDLVDTTHSKAGPDVDLRRDVLVDFLNDEYKLSKPITDVVQEIRQKMKERLGKLPTCSISEQTLRQDVVFLRLAYEWIELGRRDVKRLKGVPKSIAKAIARKFPPETDAQNSVVEPPNEAYKQIEAEVLKNPLIFKITLPDVDRFSVDRYVDRGTFLEFLVAAKQIKKAAEEALSQNHLLADAVLERGTRIEEQDREIKKLKETLAGLALRADLISPKTQEEIVEEFPEAGDILQFARSMMRKSGLTSS